MSHTAASELESVAKLRAGLRRVVTSREITAPPAAVWRCLRYYEQLEQSPPWLLRMLLPTPVRTVGRKSEVGDEALCEYRGGHLRKRVTEIVEERLYRFEVVSQALPLHGARLLGGSYRLEPLPGGTTRLSLETRYLAGPRSGWLSAPIEKQVCHAFHRHILGAMEAAVHAGPAD